MQIILCPDYMYKWIFSLGGDGDSAVWGKTDAEYETSSINKTMSFYWLFWRSGAVFVAQDQIFSGCILAMCDSKPKDELFQTMRETGILPKLTQTLRTALSQRKIQRMKQKHRSVI